MSNTLYNAVPYVAPSWMLQSLSGTGNIHNIPTQRVQLGRFPTPFHTFNVFDDLHTGLNFFIKRDDLSSFDLSGNKVRKLEFLLGDALAGDYDSVITIGGIQSNHARSTAVAARQLGFDPFIILRTREPEADPGLVGNLLLDRLIGSKIYQVLELPSSFIVLTFHKLPTTGQSLNLCTIRPGKTTGHAENTTNRRG
jgi:D-cysteine desulfhydrase